jgi:hypothetical protein
VLGGDLRAEQEGRDEEGVPGMRPRSGGVPRRRSPELLIAPSVSSNARKKFCILNRIEFLAPSKRPFGTSSTENRKSMLDEIVI